MSALGALKGPEENTEWKIAAKDNVAQDRKKEDTEYYHHPLHKSNMTRLGVAAVTAGKGALLPDFSAVIQGQNRIHKKRDVLLNTDA